MIKVAKDTVVRVHYTGTFPDSGEEFDTSRNGDPLTFLVGHKGCLLYTSPSPRDATLSRMPSSA